MAKTAKMRKEYSVASIKRRLSAALCMVLVSLIMLVTSTYAWFTLSVAPEVRGIDTSVAGNGSLEVALMPASGLLTDITSGRAGVNGGGTIAVPTANNTWGNLVTIDDSYGLYKLEMVPGTVNIDAQGRFSFTAPDFGYDGRVKSTSTDAASPKSFNGLVFNSDNNGVRAYISSASQRSTADKITSYGYVIDLAFRLNTLTENAVGKLILQKDATQRVYSGTGSYLSEATETLGGGSALTFTGAGAARAKSAARVAFVRDLGNTADGVTPSVIAYARVGDDNKLEVYDPSTGDAVEGNVILDAMNLNDPYQISAVVWIDGGDVTNADLAPAGNGEAALKAVLNLQFTTDVALVPALDVDLRDNPPVDKSALINKITLLNTLNSKIPENPMTASQKAAINSAITAAQAVASKAGATSEEIDEQLLNLTKTELQGYVALANVYAMSVTDAEQRAEITNAATAAGLVANDSDATIEECQAQIDILKVLVPSLG